LHYDPCPEWDSFDVTQLYEDAKAAGTEFGLRIKTDEDHGGDFQSYSYDSRETRAVTDQEPYSLQKPYLLIEYEEATIPPTITDLSWSPKGEFVAVSSGAALVGATEELKVITLNYTAYPELIDEGEAYLERIDLEGNSLSKFAVAEYDHFRFDNEEWWALNIICGPECDIVTFANETAEALKTPKIGDEIQFACNIDWHGAEPDRIEWYYAKAPNRCFTHEEAAGLWELFASEQLPTHTFEAEDDHEITFLKVLAKNANGDISELGDTCRPVFNLWKYKPSWWDQLLTAVRTADEEIATPITDLFTGGEIEGWTEPPFECPICEQVFEGEGTELEYAEHLMSHIKAFEKAWFKK
jgi:hypothetical protein